MIELLQQFEHVSAQLKPAFLVIPGLTSLIIGVTIWLGGLHLRTALILLCGAATGFAAAFTLGQSYTICAITACVLAILAIVLVKIFITILSAAVVAVLILTLLSPPTGVVTATTEYNNTADAEPATTEQSIEILKEFAANFKEKFKTVVTQANITHAAIAAVAAIAVMEFGFFFNKTVSAFCFSSLGTALIFSGIILLLLFKGSSPILHITASYKYYAALFWIMIGFGMSAQLILRPLKKKGTEPQNNSV